MSEIWKIIEEFPDYEASNQGRVRRAKEGGNHFCKVGRILRPQVAKNGYLFVNLFKEKVAYRRSIHRVVCTTFNGPPPSIYHEVGHLDGSRTVNCADNLKWCTRKENHADKKIHGTSQTGQRNGNSKLLDEQVIQILNEDGNQSSIARKFGVSQTTVWRIKSRRHSLAATGH